MTWSHSGARLVFVAALTNATAVKEAAITERRTIKRETIREEGAERHEPIENHYPRGIPHGDEEVGGAIRGGVVGAVVAGPVGAVVGGAIGAASGAVAGAIDQKDKDNTVVVTHKAHRPQLVPAPGDLANV